MPRQRHEAKLDQPMAETFVALAGVVARGRWMRQFSLDPADAIPRAGCRYEQQRGSVLRRGRVLECIRPVSITLHETLLDPPCCVRLRLRWRLEPLETGSFLRLDASFDLNGAAALRRRHWNGRIRAHCGRMIAALVARLDERAARADHFSGVSGQNTGSSSMTETKMSADSGKPTFR
ncbi:MAG: hypothetical protein JXB36_05510 [Gammaproteobacteria bacterium]|nr:hypothetical protein [Gammaproteobacteria bacterium]